MINRAVLDQVEEAIDSFEENWSPAARDNITGVLETYGLTQDSAALTELIRIDIELRYKHGIAVQLEDYFTEFDELLNDLGSVAQIAFEDYRSRSARGHSIAASRWEDLPGMKDEIWFQQLAWERSSLRPTSVIRQQRILSDPDPAFESELEAIGFRLVQPIGEGAFSRVYLATQNELADRFVVLKIVNQALAEPQNMAMLQHTNIVPIYSFHRILSRSVICMPYAGSVTLEEFLKDKPTTDARGGESLVVTVRNRVCGTTVASTGDKPAGSNGRVRESKPAFLIPAADESAVLRPLELIRSLGCNELATWIFSRLAAALAHSHARGVLHGDLKPGNVLIRNDGEPALLDFNLSQSLARETAQHVGGTLPYMAPETYCALMGQSIESSGSSDIYSLGVMLFEFVSGRMPYHVPRSMAGIDLEPAIEARKGAPDWRDEDAVSPSLRSIIDRCLAFAPENRYRSADELRQDLECEREDISLIHAPEPRRIRIKKWTRRHPRTILGAVAVASLLLLIPVAAAAAAWRSETIHMAAAANYDAFAKESASVLSAIMVDPKRHEESGVAAALKPLEDFGILDGSGLAELESPKITPEQRQRQRDTLLRHVAQVAFAETDRLRPVAAKGPLGDDQLQRLDRLIAAANTIRGSYVSRACVFLDAKRAQLAGDMPQYEKLIQQAEAMKPASDSEEYLDAVRLISDRQWNAAREMLTSLADGNSVPSNLRWTMLGRSQYNAKDYEAAKISFTQSIEHADEASRLRFLRGLSYYKLREYDRAETDFSEVIELEPDFAAAWLHRGLCRCALRRLDDGIADYDQTLALSPGNAHVLLVRSRAHRNAEHTEQADRDFADAMKAEDQSPSALLTRAQARKEFDPEGALADLEMADALDPGARAVLTQMSRVLNVRLHRPDQAMPVLDRLLEIYSENEAGLIDRAVLLAYKQRYDEAIRDMEKAIKPPNASRTLYQTACMYAQFPDLEHHRLALSYLAKAFQAGYQPKPHQLDEDPDLEPIRDMIGFRAIRRTYQLGKIGPRLVDSTDDDKTDDDTTDDDILFFHPISPSR